MVNDLILQVNSGHVLWVGHSDSQQDAHQQVHYLSGVQRGGKSITLPKAVEHTITMYIYINNCLCNCRRPLATCSQTFDLVTLRFKINKYNQATKEEILTAGEMHPKCKKDYSTKHC